MTLLILHMLCLGESRIFYEFLGFHTLPNKVLALESYCPSTLLISSLQMIAPEKGYTEKIKFRMKYKRNSNKLSDQKRSYFLILSFPSNKVIPKITAPNRILTVTQRTAGNSEKSCKDVAISVDFGGNGLGRKHGGGVSPGCLSLPPSAPSYPFVLFPASLVSW